MATCSNRCAAFHPRVSGEFVVDEAHASDPYFSPPHARGIWYGQHEVPLLALSTPARAGNFLAVVGGGPVFRFPPPHARGISKNPADVPALGFFTPAFAGQLQVAT